MKQQSAEVAEAAGILQQSAEVAEAAGILQQLQAK